MKAVLIAILFERFHFHTNSSTLLDLIYYIWETSESEHTLNTFSILNTWLFTKIKLFSAYLVCLNTFLFVFSLWFMLKKSFKRFYVLLLIFNESYFEKIIEMYFKFPKIYIVLIWILIMICLQFQLFMYTENYFKIN